MDGGRAGLKGARTSGTEFVVRFEKRDKGLNTGIRLLSGRCGLEERFLWQQSGFLGAGSTQYLHRRRGICAFPARHVNQDPHLAELLLKSFLVTFRKAQSFKTSRLATGHEGVQKHLGTDEETDRRDHHRAELEKPAQ